MIRILITILIFTLTSITYCKESNHILYVEIKDTTKAVYGINNVGSIDSIGTQKITLKRVYYLDKKGIKQYLNILISEPYSKIKGK